MTCSPWVRQSFIINQGSLLKLCASSSACRWVDRSKLPALEFVMSKQIRGPVGVDVSSNGGVRSENVFVAADKFMLRHERREQQKAAASQVGDISHAI